VGRFVYGRTYLQRPNAVEIDPVELRLVAWPFETARMGGFFGAIRDSMPDYWGRLVIERHSGKTTLEEFDYLMAGADDRAGALGFGLNVVPPSPKRNWNRTLDLERLQRSADAIAADNRAGGDSAMAQVQDLLLDGTSMGGARPKTVVQDEDALWIAKFGRHDDRWNHPRIEHGMLLLARSSGLEVPENRVVNIGGRDVLLVRRFDRDWSGSAYHRHRMVSALTVLQAEDSATSRARWSYLLFADEVRRVSANPRQDLRELFKRICFNAAVSNLDDHPRNHAIIAKGQEWRLSPAYDLTPTPTSATDRSLGMECGPYGRIARQANIVAGAGRFQLGKEEAVALFEQVTNSVRSEWRTVMRRAGASDQDCEAIHSAMVPEGLFLEMELEEPR
jgi:serine/threonine-protein kinase HipA